MILIKNNSSLKLELGLVILRLFSSKCHDIYSLPQNFKNDSSIITLI